MAVLFGNILKVNLQQGITIRCDDGKIFEISNADLEALGTEPVAENWRVRVLVISGVVESIIVLDKTTGHDEEATKQDDFVDIDVEIVRVERLSKMLLLKTETGQGQFGPVDLSDEQWRSLKPGRKLILRRHHSGEHQLILPKETETLKKIASTLPVVPTIHHRGIVKQISAHHIVIQGDDNRDYGFMRSQFPGLDIREGDDVAFRTERGKFDVLSITVLRKKPAGWGGREPCARLKRKVHKQSHRQALQTLFDKICDDYGEHFIWYWMVPEKQPKTKAPRNLYPAVEEALCQILEIEPGEQLNLYSHQEKSLEALEQGKNVLVLTPTASGKTYCYNPAVFNLLQKDPSAHALYVFPLNALLYDQVLKLRSMAEAMPQQSVSIDLLVGGLTREKRDEIKNTPPNILATNPEMLSWLLDRQEYGQWHRFFKNLRFIVLDEVHTYRSLLGLHMAGLMRRLMIACRRNGNDNPTFVLSSATVGDPSRLPERLTSTPAEQFVIIPEADDGSKQSQRHWYVLDFGFSRQIFINKTASLLVDVLTVADEGLNAIVFARSIRDVRAIYKATLEILEKLKPALKTQVKEFASAILDNRQKQAIYNGLKSGEIRAVISTNALEAGIDIGNLDVCIIAGFPFHVMRLRQMAGRVGRRQEGSVIFVPAPGQSIDKFYRDHPEKLLTQPPEAFVIDHENFYIARKHVAAAIKSFSGGVHRYELESFGKHLDHILAKGQEEKVFEAFGKDLFVPAKRYLDGAWGIGNMRAVEQNPYLICKAAPEHRHCLELGCFAAAEKAQTQDERCDNFVQFLDRQYVYRDAHPGAIFEGADGNFYRVCDFDDDTKHIYVEQLEKDPMQRTGALWNTDIEILKVEQERELSPGVKICLGNVKITHAYNGYYQYKLIVKYRCPSCKTVYFDETMCPECIQKNGRHVKTRLFLEQSDKDYLEYPGKYRHMIYRNTLSTVACWLSVDTTLETSLKTVSPCKIQRPGNKVLALIQDGIAQSAVELRARYRGIGADAAKIVLDYLKEHKKRFHSFKIPKGYRIGYPAYYGQCVRHTLRQSLPADEALYTFEQVTGYPVTTEERHICRNCVTPPLMAAVHTIGHLVAKQYPVVALGDSQDIGFITVAVHPQTQTCTSFWYDQYEDGIGASEKIFEQIDRFLNDALLAIECECGKDEGCPICIQSLRCAYDNSGLSKEAAKGLLHVLLEKPTYYPRNPVFHPLKEDKPDFFDDDFDDLAADPVPDPDEERAGLTLNDALEIMHACDHIHKKVLDKILNIRAQEMQKAGRTVSLNTLQQAYRIILRDKQDEDEWPYDPDWEPYEHLHALEKATMKLLRTAYRTIIFEIHPDRNPTNTVRATEMTQQLNEAWELIQDRRKKGQKH